MRFVVFLEWKGSETDMKWLEHFQTVRHHRALVRAYCFRVGLYWQGLVHDLSKYSPTEFFVGAKYFQGNRSPNNAEREAKGYSASWLHHKGRNKHHFEYWIDYDFKDGKVLGGMEMPVRYVVEMFMDRIAACRVYQKEAYTQASAWEYHKKSRHYHVIHPKSMAILEELLQLLAQKGEAIAFARAEQLLREDRKKRRKESC